MTRSEKSLQIVCEFDEMLYIKLEFIPFVIVSAV